MRASPFLAPVSLVAAGAPWLKSVGLVAALHLAIAGGVAAHHRLLVNIAEEFGAENVIEFATMITSAESEYAPDAANSDAEDRQATPKLDETLSKKHEEDLPTEQASPEAPLDPELRMAQERTQKESEIAPENLQTTEAMVQQEQSQSSVASIAADATPEQTGAVKEPEAKAPEAGNSDEAQRRIEAWQRRIFAHIVKYKHYPEAARGQRLTGEAMVAFSLDAQGQVSQVRVTRSSGSMVLDKAAMDVLQRASPLPKPPAMLAAKPFDLALPMRFALK